MLFIRRWNVSVVSVMHSRSFDKNGLSVNNTSSRSCSQGNRAGYSAQRSVRATCDIWMAWMMKQSWSAMGLSGSHSQPLSRFFPDSGKIQKLEMHVHGDTLHCPQLFEHPICLWGAHRRNRAI